MRTAKTVILVVCVLVSGIATGAVIHVPGDQPTIQAGIDAAINGDTVLVADGTWTGDGNNDLNFGGKAITVRSENGPVACIIEMWDTDTRGFIFNSGEGTDSVVEGFTISGAYIGETGGAIRCGSNSSPTIRNNIIRGNAVYDTNGGGIYCDHSSPVIIDNIIHDNNAFSGGSGGGIFCYGGAPIIANNLIYDNRAQSEAYYDIGGDGGGIVCHGSSPLVIDNLIFNNDAGGNGGGLYIYLGDPTLLHNTIVDNSCYEYGGGLYSSQSSSTVTDCILWGNTPNSIYVYSGSPVVTYCNVQDGFTGTGNIDTDPLFISDPDCDYLLSHLDAGDPADSPCIDAGSDLAENLCYAAGPETICMNTRTTRSDQQYDRSTVDMGYHSDSGTLAAELTCVPNWGTLPMTCNFGIFLHNLTDYHRTFAAHLDVTLANGTSFSNYRAGSTNMSPLEDFETHWPQNIPLLESVTGNNTFQFVSQDVTPTPYNQPPAPPSGDTEQVTCTVVGSQGKTLSSSLTCQPVSEYLPFTSEICIELRNLTGYHRRLSYQVARTLADGSFDPNYRSGYENVVPNGICTRCWEDSFLDDGSSAGINTYQLYGEDVTPLPYNQPPLPLAGHTDTATVAVEGIDPPNNNWYVDNDNCPGPGSGTLADPFCTIQQGIEAAVDFDIVLVADGTYTGNGNRDLDYGGRRITIRSMNGPAACIIDCQGTPGDPHRGFSFIGDEGPDSILDGLTITGGDTLNGGGIFCDSASPTIRNCHINGNSDSGLFLRYCSSTITDCVVSGNQNSGNGGGFTIVGIGLSGPPTIIDCAITGNQAGWGGGGIYRTSGDLVISNCVIADNSAEMDGGGIYLASGADVIISSCTIVDNTYADPLGDGGGIYSDYYTDDSVVINTILWGNAPGHLHDQLHHIASGTVTYCDIADGFPGTGNIHAAPLFIPGPAGPYYLVQIAAGQPVDSPCLDAGSSLAADICFTTTSGIRCLDQYTTRKDQVTDTGQVDIGFHYPAP